MIERAQTSPGIDWRRTGRTVAIVVGLAVLVYILTLIPKTVEIFVFGALVAFGVNPIVLHLSRRMPRLLAIALVYVIVFALVLVAALIVVPDTVNQMQAVFANSATYADDIHRFLLGVEGWLQSRFKADLIPPQFQAIENHVLNEASSLAQNVLSNIGTFVIGIANAVIIGLGGIFISYYLLAHAADIRTFYYSLFPKRSQTTAHTFAREAARIFGGYMVGNGLLFGFTAAATFAVLAILHAPYALLVAIVTGLLYLVPYLGLLVAIVVGMLLGLLQSWGMALEIGVVILAVTRVSDYVIAPKVMGESVGVSPVTIIFALFAGGELFGLWGLILAIPAAALIKVVWNLWLRPWLTGEPTTYAISPEHVLGLEETEPVVRAGPAVLNVPGVPQPVPPQPGTS